MKGILNKFSNSILVFISIIILFFAANSSEAINYSFMEKSHLESNESIIELISVSVPTSLKQDWLKVEKDTWGSWLESKEGFLGRQLFWNKANEEGIIFITWSSRQKWKAIPIEELDDMQCRFENVARNVTGQENGNPFPLNSVVEWLPQ